MLLGADPEMRTEDGWTVLHSAACWAANEIVGLLLSHGVEVNSRVRFYAHIFMDTRVSLFSVQRRPYAASSRHKLGRRLA